jgi:hypothetical protein
MGKNCHAGTRDGKDGHKVFAYVFLSNHLILNKFVYDTYQPMDMINISKSNIIPKFIFPEPTELKLLFCGHKCRTNNKEVVGQKYHIFTHLRTLIFYLMLV